MNKKEVHRALRHTFFYPGLAHYADALSSPCLKKTEKQTCTARRKQGKKKRFSIFNDLLKTKWV